MNFGSKITEGKSCGRVGAPCVNAVEPSHDDGQRIKLTQYRVAFGGALVTIECLLHRKFKARVPRHAGARPRVEDQATRETTPEGDDNGRDRDGGETNIDVPSALERTKPQRKAR